MEPSADQPIFPGKSLREWDRNMRQALTLSALVMTVAAILAVGVSAMVNASRASPPIEVAVDSSVRS
jgi:hypothetical protein